MRQLDKAVAFGRHLGQEYYCYTFDYAHTPDAVKSFLKDVKKSFPNFSLITVVFAVEIEISQKKLDGCCRLSKFRKCNFYER